MTALITTQSELVTAARAFAAKYPGRGFQITTREWYNDAFEIRANPAVAKALVKKGVLRLAASVSNSARYSRPTYYLNNETRNVLQLGDSPLYPQGVEFQLPRSALARNPEMVNAKVERARKGTSEWMYTLAIDSHNRYPHWRCMSESMLKGQLAAAKQMFAAA